MPTDFFLDTFTGSGDLSTHVPDLGGPWIITPPALGSAAFLVLDGSGDVTRSASATNGTYNLQTTGMPGAGEFTVEIDVSAIDDVASGGNGASLLIIVENSSTFASAQCGIQSRHTLLVSAPTTSTVVSFEYSAFVGGVSFAPAAYPPLTAGAMHTLGVNVSSDRKTFNFLQDGALIDTHTFVSALAFDRIRMQWTDAFNDRITWSRAHGSWLSPLFWTDFVATQETP